MAKGVGAEPASLRGVFEGQAQGMRVNYYPPCRQAADRVLGLTAHTDPNGLTLLLQMNDDVQGLQVKKDGKWFAVQALAGAFIVNVGDALEVLALIPSSPEMPRPISYGESNSTDEELMMLSLVNLQIMSNGVFRSVEHRAVIHPTKERISVALFHYPYQDRMLGPLPELVKKGDRLQYGPTDYQDLLKRYFTAKLDGRKHLERFMLEQ